MSAIPPSPRRPLGILLALLLAALQCLPAAWAQASPVIRESAVKAAYLSKFGGFVEWPAGTLARPEDPMVIGIAGNDAVALDLEQIAASRAADGRPLTLRRLREGDSTAGLHVLFIGAGAEARARQLAAAVRGPVLVVTEQEDGLRHGGMLNFVVDQGRVRFTASVPAAEANGLRLSARLLAVAQAVESRGR